MNRRCLLITALAVLPLIGCAATPPSSTTGDPLETPLPPELATIVADDWAYDTLGELCDTVGHRLAGSDGMRRAAAWAVRTMEEAGFDSVWTEPVTVPHWTRGAEWARCTAPVPFDLTILGLGLSDGTGPEGIEAEILVVKDFDELDVRADEAAGRIVVFAPPWKNYGTNVRYRVNGASRAAAHGAVAVLVRSAAPDGQNNPHTGMMHYADDVPRIPAAAITAEDAGRLQRLTARGGILRVKLFMEAAVQGETTCHNVVGDIRGDRWPEQIVLVGGHLDSWDTGTGAHDDGAGCVMTLAAAREMLRDGGRPGRTVRMVFYTAEEIGAAGGRAYLDAHRDELDNHVAALESDSGGFAPAGFTVQADSLIIDQLAEYARPLEPLGAAKVSKGWSGVDIRPICEMGVPGIGHRVHGERYFDYHHSPADTFDKVDRDDLTWNVAAIATLVRAIADDPVPLRERAAGDN